MNDRQTSAEDRQSISELVQRVRDVATDEVAGEVLGIHPFEVEPIAKGHDFNHDKYSRVTASLGLQPHELRTPKAIAKCNWSMTQLVLRKHGITLSGLPNFHGLLRVDRVMSPEEIESCLMQAGVEHQKPLGI